MLSERETETTVNPSVRMQPGGYNTELIARLISSSLGENLRVNLPKLKLPVLIIIIIITSTSDLQPSTAIANQLPGH